MIEDDIEWSHTVAAVPRLDAQTYIFSLTLITHVNCVIQIVYFCVGEVFPPSSTSLKMIVHTLWLFICVDCLHDRRSGANIHIYWYFYWNLHIYHQLLLFVSVDNKLEFHYETSF